MTDTLAEVTREDRAAAGQRRQPPRAPEGRPTISSGANTPTGIQLQAARARDSLEQARSSPRWRRPSRHRLVVTADRRLPAFFSSVRGMRGSPPGANYERVEARGRRLCPMADRTEPRSSAPAEAHIARPGRRRRRSRHPGGVAPAAVRLPPRCPPHPGIARRPRSRGDGAVPARGPRARDRRLGPVGGLPRSRRRRRGLARCGRGARTVLALTSVTGPVGRSSPRPRSRRGRGRQAGRGFVHVGVQGLDDAALRAHAECHGPKASSSRTRAAASHARSTRAPRRRFVVDGRGTLRYRGAVND